MPSTQETCGEVRDVYDRTACCVWMVDGSGDPVTGNDNITTGVVDGVADPRLFNQTKSSLNGREPDFDNGTMAGDVEFLPVQNWLTAWNAWKTAFEANPDCVCKRDDDGSYTCARSTCTMNGCSCDKDDLVGVREDPGSRYRTVSG